MVGGGEGFSEAGKFFLLACDEHLILATLSPSWKLTDGGCALNTFVENHIFYRWPPLALSCNFKYRKSISINCSRMASLRSRQNIPPITARFLPSLSPIIHYRINRIGYVGIAVVAQPLSCIGFRHGVTFLYADSLSTDHIHQEILPKHPCKCSHYEPRRTGNIQFYMMLDLGPRKVARHTFSMPVCGYVL